MAGRVDWSQLSPELQAQLRQRGASAPRKPRKLTKERERQHALRVLGSLSVLTQAERARVLRYALKVNDIK